MRFREVALVALIGVVFAVVFALPMALSPTSARAAGGSGDGKAPAQGKEGSMTVQVKVFNKAGDLVGPFSTPKVVKTDAEWKAILTDEQFRITRDAGTERPFCGTLLDNKKEGVYACVCCGLPLFASNAKFNSGTGWPSFFQPIAKENVTEIEDRSHGMVRTEINCARCDGHLGHVFDDGPRPTGLRFCLNSESLAFTEQKDLASLADPLAETARGADSAAIGAAALAAGAKGGAGPGGRAEAVFAGGCFWCVEAVFEELDGVIEVVSGYAGGARETANYEAVCTGKTGHAEAVKIVYDPSKIDFATLLHVHFATHDPTTLNRQGNDSGPQYRSAIFYASDEEKRVAEAYIKELTDKKAFPKPIVTTLEPLKEFYPAEAYHQNYACNNPFNGYIKAVAMPKVDKVREKFKDRLKEVSPLEQPAGKR